jgi:hypothetical protein
MRLPKPCPICSAQEKWSPEHQRFENPVHDYELHNLARPESVRMSSEELFSIPNPDFSKLGDRREA